MINDIRIFTCFYIGFFINWCFMKKQETTVLFLESVFYKKLHGKIRGTKFEIKALKIVHFESESFLN